MNDNSVRDTLATGYELHWFEMQSVLGRGGYGVTYLAVDKNLDRKVAIKEYFPMDFAARQGDQTVVPRGGEQEGMYKWGLERFLKEARTLAKFNHPNIVRVISVFEQNGTAYMVMEYEQGRSLSDVFKTKASFSEEELLDIFIPVIDGLSLVHEAGFIHRDIKPSNIYIREDGSPVLLDFGSARQSTGQTRTLTSLVTYGYAPFEQYNEGSEKQGPWTDIYSLGATIYFGITKHKPEDAMRRGGCILAKTPDPYKPVSISAKGKYTENFLLTIDNSMRFHVDDRPQDAITWAQMLLGNIKAPQLPKEFLLDSASASDNTMVMPARARDRADTGDRSKPNTGRLIDASGRRVSTHGVTGPADEVGAPSRTSARPASKVTNPKVMIVIALLALVGVGVVVVLKIPALQKAVLPVTMQKKISNLIADASSQSGLDKPQFDPKQIAALLKQADQQYAAGKYLTPKGKSAAHYYQAILQKDPSNQKASVGIENIVQKYTKTAIGYLGKKDLKHAEAQLNQLKAANIISPEIVALREQISAAKDKSMKIELMLKDAEIAYNAHHFTEPDNDNALEKYNKVLLMDPANKEAKRGINKMFNYYLLQARSQLQTGKDNKVDSLVAKLDDIKPGSAEARELRKQIKHVSSNNKKVNTLLDRADNAYRAGHYVEPASKNAFYYYNQVLKLESGNSNAKRGIEQLRKFFKRQFDGYIAHNQLDMAGKMIAGLKVVEPNAPQLAGMTQQLKERRKPQRPDIEAINDLMTEFKSVIESRNIKKLKEISEFTPGRKQFVDQFYANYKSVSVSVSGFEFIAKEHKAKARVELVNLVNNDGQPVIAGAWGKFQILVQRNKNYQWRIFW